MNGKRIGATAAGITLLAALSAGPASGYESEAAVPLPVAKTMQIMSTAESKNAEYVGSETCSKCHQGVHKALKESWHANMLRKFNPSIVKADFNNVEISYKDVEIEVSDEEKVKISPTIRLSKSGDDFLLTLIDKEDAANYQTFRIAYVFGGNWNQHFEAQVGTAYYPTPMRWVVEDGQWTSKPFNDLWWVADGTPDGRPRKPEEFKPSKEANVTCNGCHTTGLAIVKDKVSGKWTADIKELGITCESCHGPGSRHVALQTRESIVNPASLNAVQQDQLCGRCHSRVTNKQEKELSYPVGFLPGNTDLQERVNFWDYSLKPKNFWPNGFSRKNRQQYHDVQFSSHQEAGVTCITCHDVHSTRKGYAQLRGEKEKLCHQCHEINAEMFGDSTMAKALVGCTDCHMSRIASRSDATQKIKEHWEVSSHAFAAITPRKADELNMRSSCDICHEGVDRSAKGSFITERQIEIKMKIAEVETIIAAVKKKGGKVKESQKLLIMVKDDRSFGAHNPQKAMSLLDKALKSMPEM